MHGWDPRAATTTAKLGRGEAFERRGAVFDKKELCGLARTVWVDLDNEMRVASSEAGPRCVTRVWTWWSSEARGACVREVGRRYSYRPITMATERQGGALEKA